MNIHDLFPSKHVAAIDLKGQDVTVIMREVVVEKVGAKEDIKPVVYFQGMTKGLVLNRTNSKRIAGMYGAQIENWVGKSITIFPTTTEMAGDTVSCVRVREVASMITATPTPPVQAPPPPISTPSQPAGGVSF